MAIKTRYLAIGLTILVAIGVASCDSRNKNPVQSPNTPSPTAPAIGVSSIEIVPPSSIAPGESVQLTAKAGKTDDSVEIVDGGRVLIIGGSVTAGLSSTGTRAR
jgi:hypothetical protein